MSFVAVDVQEVHMDNDPPAQVPAESGRFSNLSGVKTA